MSDSTADPAQHGGAGRKRKIRLGGEHMNLQPSAPISGEKIRKIKPFVFKTRDQKQYLERLCSSPCRSSTQRKCNSRRNCGQANCHTQGNVASLRGSNPFL